FMIAAVRRRAHVIASGLLSGCSFIFFFKQKTAYEIGLGIPAEPLFRSSSRRVILVVWFLLPRVARLMIHTPTAISIFVCLSMVQLMEIGRASCRERVEMSVVAGSLKKRKVSRKRGRD